MAWADTKLAAALAKMVLSSAVPTEPPTCWEVLTIAEATPASLRLTPSVAVPIRRREDAAHADADEQQRGQHVA